MPQRFTIKQPKNAFIHVSNETSGPIAQGMHATLKIEIATLDPKAAGKVQDEFQLVTKAEIFKIPVFARVLPQEEFESLQSEAFKLHNRPLLLPTIRELGKEIKKHDVMEGSLGKMGKIIKNIT